ncbi:MAG TPA: SDR family NAD(P)-dependent oxidoreductase [Roseiarcus sp.]|nr:SDR family NAD(P)-dependent oxidoreductase [Roseiarcus sp.]
MPVIAIVGAGLGIGRAIARIFGARGFRVALLSRDPARQEPTVAALAEEGVEAVAFRADAGDPASLAAGLAAAKQRAR